MERLKDDTTIPEADRGRAPASPPSIGLIVVWSANDPLRLGAWLPARHVKSTLGRGAPEATDGVPRVEVLQQRPESNVALPPFENPSLSRRQLELSPRSEASLGVRNVGQCRMLVNGTVTAEADLRPGDIVEIGAQLVLLCAQRPFRLPPSSADRSHRFGEADAGGYVGESPAAWQLRSELAFAAPRAGHVLLRGPSGSGKDLAASALHAASGRSRPFVARNAATLPESLVDAELFGNSKNYPNPGMPERKGLIGAADGGTLFLDEFAELSLAHQAHLLRAMDAGEYQRLGETQLRRSDLRVVGATNRPESALREDMLARFSFAIEVPDLSCRREDVPLILRHLASGLVASNDVATRRFAAPSGELRIGASLVVHAMRLSAPGNVRHLRNLLLRSLAESPADVLEAPADASTVPPPASFSDTTELAPEHLRAVLDANKGSVEKTWRALGLSSRHALKRLMKKQGVEISRSINPTPPGSTRRQ